MCNQTNSQLPFEQLFDSHALVTVYGKLVSPFATEAVTTQGAGIYNTKLGLNIVSVYGYKAFGHCGTFPHQLTLVVVGDGEEATNCGWDEHESVRQWTLGPDDYVLAMAPTVGKIGDILTGETVIEPLAICASVTVENGQVCLNLPVVGRQCIDIPVSIPNGTIAEACADICKKWGIPCGVKAYVRVGGRIIAEEKFGCC